MGQKHSKWSLHEKQKKSCVYYEKYTAFAAPEYRPPAQSSPGASVGTSDGSSTGVTEGATQLTDDQINPLITLEALPTEEVTENQPDGRLGQGNTEGQPAVDEMDLMGRGPDGHRTPDLDNSSLEAKETLPNEVVLQELEDPSSDATTVET